MFTKIRYCENSVAVLELIKNISSRGTYGFTRLTRKTAITVANGLHEPNESYPLIEREILTIDLIDFDVRHLENKEKNRDIEREIAFSRYSIVQLRIVSFKLA